ncbi:MAG: hypothetical protein EA389_00605 [Ilumatobacter sp.]|nr:MAG: hypothetical protein EA389_00605 [Ilumatobacter sp.]
MSAMQRRRGWGALLLMGVLGAGSAGCSGDESDASSAGSTVPPSTVSSTTGPSADTAEPEPTPVATEAEISETTTSTTSTTSTVAATTTTTEAERSIEELEAEVAAAYELVYEGYWECLRSPLDCDTSWLVEGSGSAVAMQNTMQGLADRDRYVGDDPVGYFVIESIEFNDDQTEATVVTCWWSTAVLYTTPVDPTRPPGPDNPPTVVNDTPGTSRQMDRLERSLGLWAVRHSETIESVAGENKCG